MPEALEIKGGADAYVAAAIMAALQIIWEEETQPETAAPLSQEAWVLAGRTRPAVASATPQGEEERSRRQRPNRGGEERA